MCYKATLNINIAHLSSFYNPEGKKDAKFNFWYCTYYRSNKSMLESQLDWKWKQANTNLIVEHVLAHLAFKTVEAW